MSQSPHVVMAQHFMASKGYPGLEPFDVTKLDDQDCWYFYYQLPEGTLELEVMYDHRTKDWNTMVTAFPAGQLP